MTIVDEIVEAQKRGEAKGVTSICSAHPIVLEAVFKQARADDAHLLVESTCNQVNQYGGYTGMIPSKFVNYLTEMADQHQFPLEKLTLGGDHLGPEVWKDEPSKDAMGKASILVEEYVKAGYKKIHLDASMKLGDDLEDQLPKEVSAARSAELAQVAENAYKECGFGPPPCYIIGSEVPPPGGAQDLEDHVQVTSVVDAAEILDISKQVFYSKGLESAWERVVALVVQPGVEFGDDFILAYDRDAAFDLSRFIETKCLIYEAHSTDYQTSAALRQMVEDHFAILKVGPALTFAYREAIFSLAMMESVLFPEEDRSNLVNVVDKAMVVNPSYWRRYYHGKPYQQWFARRYSYSDRIRYYWSQPEVQMALEKLNQNLRNIDLPMTLISQYAPEQYQNIRYGKIACSPDEIVLDRIMAVLRAYRTATQT